MKGYNSERNFELNDNALKKAYISPQLSKIGNVKDLTLGEGSLNYDEGSLVEDLE